MRDARFACLACRVFFRRCHPAIISHFRASFIDGVDEDDGVVDGIDSADEISQVSRKRIESSSTPPTLIAKIKISAAVGGNDKKIVYI